MQHLLTKTEKLPLSNLPYIFQKRLIALAPLRILNELGRVVQDIKMFRSFCLRAYDQLFITDHPVVYKWAVKDTFLFEFFKYMHQFAFLRYLLDGDCNVNPMWQTVLCVDEIIERNQPIYVEDTLILYCASINAYQKVIPFICGPYTRLILHGNINFHQVVRLTHPGVKKIRINANIEIPPIHYDYFAELMVNQVQGINSSFTIANNKNVEENLREASRRHRRYFNEREQNIYIATHLHNNCYFLMRALIVISNILIGFISCALLGFILDKNPITPFIFITFVIYTFLWFCSLIIISDWPDSLITNDEVDQDVLQNRNSQNFISAAFCSLWSAIDTKLYKLVVKK